jgi:hypothetical protein
MVVIGHSMGGCISRLLITDTDKSLCRGQGGQPLTYDFSVIIEEGCHDLLELSFRQVRAAYVRTLAPLVETFHSRGEEMARRVEFYTELRYFMT